MKPKFDNTKVVKPLNRAIGTQAQLDALNTSIESVDAPLYWHVSRKGNGKTGKARTTDQHYRAYKPEDVAYPAAGEYVLRFATGKECPVAGKQEDFEKVVNIPGSSDTPMDPDAEPINMGDVYAAQDRRANSVWFQRKGGDAPVWVSTKGAGGATLAWPGTGGAWCRTDSAGNPIPLTNKGGK